MDMNEMKDWAASKTGGEPQAAAEGVDGEAVEAAPAMSLTELVQGHIDACKAFIEQAKQAVEADAGRHDTSALEDFIKSEEDEADDLDSILVDLQAEDEVIAEEDAAAAEEAADAEGQAA